MAYLICDFSTVQNTLMSSLAEFLIETKTNYTQYCNNWMVFHQPKCNKPFSTDQ